MDLKAEVNAYMKYLAHRESKPKNNVAYSGWINECAEYLASQTVEIGSRIIMGYLGEYIEGVRENREMYPDAYNKVLGPNPIISDFEWAIATTIKENKYTRFVTIPIVSIRTDVIKDIAKKALSMPYNDAVNLMGEIAGAWVLTYPPGVSMKEYVKIIFHHYPKGWPSEEEDFIYILGRHLDIEFLEWMR
jgi:hypothetical protein